MKLILTIFIAVLSITTASAQRVTDKLDRGLVAVAKASGVFVSWRILPEEYYDVTYNLYRNGTKIASNLTVSNYTDSDGSDSNTYTVSTVDRNGTESAQCTAVSVWATGRVAKSSSQPAEQPNYLNIQMQDVVDRNGNIVFCCCGSHTPASTVAQNYILNDCSMADLDGDGEMEIIVKRINQSDASSTDEYAFNNEIYSTTNTRAFVLLEAYKLNGTRLWWIDCGPNMVSMNSTEIDAVAYDWDEDGKAEVVLRGADNMIIHPSTGSGQVDGTSYTVGNGNVNTRSAMTSHTDPQFAWTHTGSEYLIYMNGQTGVPYQVTDFPLKRLESGEKSENSAWGDDYGHRSNKFFYGAPVLDGKKASIFLARGIYTRHKMIALDVDPATHTLTTRWTWNNNTSGSPWYGQGNHNYSIADVDGDGRDEIIYGSMVIDDNGKGLSTTGLGHGDALHVGDFDPYRKGLEVFACNEAKPANNYRNATTSEIYYRVEASDDDGRAMMDNFTNTYPGSVGRSIKSGWISSTSDKEVTELGDNNFISGSDLNWRIYWDGDLCSEYFESPGEEREAVVYKPQGGRLMQSSGCKLNNSSKNNPCFIGDVLGDWREEIIVRASDNKALRMFTTTEATSYRIPSLWSDPEYRQSMVWQCCAYNQPPHVSYFVGELEGITQAPPTNTMTGKTEIKNGGSISTTSGHLIICETNNTSVSIPAAGTSPSVMEFNIPSHVEGTVGSNSSTKDATINYTYYTCNVTGGALTGSTRLVKDGDGILNLPDVTMTHTGNTDIWGGTVNFNGTMKNSDVWLNRHTTLNTTNGNFKSLKMEYGSTLNVNPSTGSGQAANTVTVGTLEMHEGARIKLNLSNGDKLNITNLTLRQQSWEYGPKYLAPVIELTTTGKLETGQRYEIGTVSGTVTGDPTKVIIETNTVLESKAYLTVKDGKLYVRVGSFKDVSGKIYERGVSTAWSASDLATTEWHNETGTGSEAAISADPYLTMTRTGNSSTQNSYMWEKTLSTVDFTNMTFKAVWNPGEATGTNNKCYLTFGDIEFALLGQSSHATVTIGGQETILNEGGTNDKTLRSKDWDITLSIDKDTHEVTYAITVNSTTYSGKGTTASDFSNLDMGLNVNKSKGIVNWNLTQYLKSVSISGSGNILVGDVNDDGKINISDLSTLINFLKDNGSDTTSKYAADVNSDDNVDTNDVKALEDILIHNS